MNHIFHDAPCVVHQFVTFHINLYYTESYLLCMHVNVICLKSESINTCKMCKCTPMFLKWTILLSQLHHCHLFQFIYTAVFNSAQAAQVSLWASEKIGHFPIFQVLMFLSLIISLFVSCITKEKPLQISSSSTLCFCLWSKPDLNTK